MSSKGYFYYTIILKQKQEFGKSFYWQIFNMIAFLSKRSVDDINRLVNNAE